jgi:hypothetical protein
VQDQHTVACDGYFALPVRTNYEQVISHRSGDLFSVIAEQDGVIESLNEVGGIIKYKDGSTKGFSLGRKFGKAAGQVIPHEIVSNYSVGEKVKKGDVIAYNSGWFEKDYFNPGQVLMKTGLLCTVALIESPQTHEDACTITEELAAKLKTNLSKVKKVRLSFKDTITDLIAIGTNVTFETPLVLIQDETTANMGAFNEATIATLASISQQAPTAKTVGKIEDIVVYYNGDKEDMSPSIRALANYGDKLLAFKAKSRGEQVFTGSTDESYRIDGDPLLQDELCIEFYITQDVNAGIADKVVFANQMKSIICEVADYDIVTESGIKVDAFFGAYSIFKRIVNSAFSFGTTNILAEIGAKEALKIYKGK